MPKSTDQRARTLLIQFEEGRPRTKMPDPRSDPEIGQEARRLLREIADLHELRALRQESLVNIDRKLAYLEREYAELLGTEARRPAAIVPPQSKPAYGGVKNAVLELLASADDGLTSVQLARSLQIRFGTEMHPKSHLQALKRLSDDSLAEKKGKVWRLTKAGADAAVRLRTWD